MFICMRQYVRASQSPEGMGNESRKGSRVCFVRVLFLSLSLFGLDGDGGGVKNVNIFSCLRMLVKNERRNK